MLVSYKWLSEYVDLQGISAETLADRLTKAGLEVDAVHYRDKGVTNVVVGYVTEKASHPDADKLSVCKVDVGQKEALQIGLRGKKCRSGTESSRGTGRSGASREF